MFRPYPVHLFAFRRVHGRRGSSWSFAPRKASPLRRAAMGGLNRGAAVETACSVPCKKGNALPASRKVGNPFVLAKGLKEHGEVPAALKREVGLPSSMGNKCLHPLWMPHGLWEVRCFHVDPSVGGLPSRAFHFPCFLFLKSQSHDPHTQGPRDGA